ncbi:MAG: 1-acyl-sn-glycerol-3-phosphate acyltransferase [Bacteroidales bacterium]|nr:1-acyl-sn-glycerol-3-phosphate acyltransferase [Bacteroidales bacterium]
MASGLVKDAGLGFKEYLLRGIGYVMAHLVHRPKVYGRKPSIDKPTIFACRHVGMMDPVILMDEYPSILMHPLVADDYYEKNGFTRFFYDTACCIPIDRHNSSRKWMYDSQAVLQKGEHIIIFPEGRRNKEGGGLLPFKTGAAYLAGLTGAQIVPVYNKFWKFPHRYRLAIGEPFELDPVPEGGATSEWAHAQTARIQEAVAALAPLLGE